MTNADTGVLGSCTAGNQDNLIDVMETGDTWSMIGGLGTPENKSLFIY